MNQNEMTLLGGVIDLLDIFNVFTTFIQGFFVIFYTEIDDRLKNIIAQSEDEVTIRAAKILMTNLEKRLPLSIEFIGAALIDPRMQRLPIIKEWLDRNGKFTVDKFNL